MKYTVYSTDEYGRYELEVCDSYQEAVELVESYERLDKASNERCIYEIEGNGLMAMVDSVRMINSEADEWLSMMGYEL